jgi:hypothetical protein
LSCPPTGRGAAWLARLSGGPEASLAMPMGRSRGLDARPLLLSPTGRGAAWLARLSGGQEVPGSNPGAPTGIRLVPCPTSGLNLMRGLLSGC